MSVHGLSLKEEDSYTKRGKSVLELLSPQGDTWFHEHGGGEEEGREGGEEHLGRER